jgi:hypothetical protein
MLPSVGRGALAGGDGSDALGVGVGAGAGVEGGLGFGRGTEAWRATSASAGEEALMGAAWSKPRSAAQGTRNRANRRACHPAAQARPVRRGVPSWIRC